MSDFSVLRKFNRERKLEAMGSVRRWSTSVRRHWSLIIIQQPGTKFWFMF